VDGLEALRRSPHRRGIVVWFRAPGGTPCLPIICATNLGERFRRSAARARALPLTREHGVHLVDARGLREMGVEPGLAGALAVLWLRIPAERHEPRVAERLVSPKRARDLVAAQIR
jgi:hypothetical protein